MTTWVTKAMCKDCTLLTDTYTSVPEHLLYFLTKAIVSERSTTKDDAMLNLPSSLAKAPAPVNVRIATASEEAP